MSFVKRIWVVFFLVFFCTNFSYASHIVGGNMSYEVVEVNAGSSRVLVTFHLVLEEESGGAELEPFYDIGVYDNGNLYNMNFRVAIQDTIEISNENNSPLFYDFELNYVKGVYQGIVTLPHNNAPFKLAYQRGCRLEEDYENTFPGQFDDKGFVQQLDITKEGLLSLLKSPTINLDSDRLLVLNENDPKRFILQNYDPNTDYNLSPFYSYKAGGLAGSSPDHPGSPDSCEDGVTPSIRDCLPPFDQVPYNTGYEVSNQFGWGSSLIQQASDSVYTLEGVPDKEGFFLYSLKVDQFNSNGDLLNSGYYDFVFEVGGKIANLSVRPFLDKNKNQIYDSTESFLGNVAVDLDKEYLLRNEQPFFTEFLLEETGDFVLQSLNPRWQINHPTGNWPVTVPGLEKVEVNLPVQSSIDGFEYDILITQTPVICDQVLIFNIDFINYSDSILNTSITFQEDNSIDRSLIRLFTPTDSSFFEASDGTLTWPIEFLNPGETGQSRLSFRLTESTKMPGDIMNFTFILVTEVGQNIITDTIVLESPLLCSFDPNNKVVAPVRKGNLIYEDEYLFYTINFQNLGNYKAINVSIIDTLSEYFDLETMEITASSHYSSARIKGNILTLDFPNINLTYADDNWLFSNGFVSYKIKPKQETPSNTEIKNSASIYFDKNAPIHTNETLNLFIPDGSFEEVEEVNVYPNPFSTEICVNLGVNIVETVKIEFYDSSGKLIKSDFISEPLSTITFSENLPIGVYFYKMGWENSKKRVSGKILKFK